eukprot:Colp12_sorted_trinity150504_noHs@23397
MCEWGHEWEGRMDNVVRRAGSCPTCVSKRVTSTNNLLAKCPAVSAEWHPVKNGSLTPQDVAWASGMKVWWKCKDGHEWESIVASRTTISNGCPTCARQRRKGAPLGTQSLVAAHPDLCDEWHPTKNGVLTPDAVSRASQKKVWWQCRYDPSHEWETMVKQRSGNHTGCPFCKRGRRPLSATNNLLALYPEVAQEWHPTLNGELAADKVTGKSSKKVWWACKGCGHEWPTRVYDRTCQGSGCPKCAYAR